MKKKTVSLNFLKNCGKLRKRILDISLKVPALHIGGSFSSIEILEFIYRYFKKENDQFIMSKGHAGIALYIILESIGLINKKDVDRYCKKNGILGCHPDYGTRGVEGSTGSLGHGPGLATGIGHANKILNNKSKIFLLLSDGELQEGSTWECFQMAANLNLDNLIIFLDHNGYQSFGKTKVTHPNFYPINKKIRSFGFETYEINGHKLSDFEHVKKKILSSKLKKPKFVICNTVKGKGVDFMENVPIWHFRSPNTKEYKNAMDQINRKYSL